MSSAISPSLTTSARFFISIGVTEVIGSTPSTSTSDNCSTNASMAFSSPCKMRNLGLGDRDPRQMRDTADGGGID